MPFFDHLKQWLFKNYNWLLRNAVKSGHKWQRISHCKRASDASLLLWESKGGGLKTISYTVHLLTKQTASLQKEHFLFAFLRIKTFLNSKASYKLLHIIVVHMGFGIQEQLWNLVSVFVLVAFGHDSPMTSPERDDHRISLIKLDAYRALMLPWRRMADNHINTCVLDSPLSTSGDTQFTGKDKRGWFGSCIFFRLNRTSVVFISRQRKCEGQRRGLNSGASSETEDQDRNIYRKRSPAWNRGL